MGEAEGFIPADERDLLKRVELILDAEGRAVESEREAAIEAGQGDPDPMKSAIQNGYTSDRLLLAAAAGPYIPPERLEHSTRKWLLAAAAVGTYAIVRHMRKK